ncbi:hypothetical protein [Achromobacter pulmonis]|uniref:hypothetical protein n=1 Tax=Achromobacter pulmonis TaxID=1389932 RepID=UPI0011B1D952|nr:hypothetical protein [Achromobacter pulmonis]
MRKPLTALSCLTIGLLAGCEKGKPPEELLIESAQQVVATQLKDPLSAQFRNMQGSEGALMVCGEINAKNGMGGYVGFKRFMVGGEVDTTSHTFKAGAIALIEPPKPPVDTSDLKAPVTKERLDRMVDDVYKLTEYEKALNVLDKCEKIVSATKLLDGLDRDANRTFLDKVSNFFRGNKD